ncbi:Hsp20/alpha crystallin family protein [Desulfuromonas sp.]|uniref:Hsp20/alpha crystallin family protein n=1 Tax=Desulfuromonas sp. TaxID=892 RepID=UPI0025C0F604|nr:Hsp20/alpha crystallin family protein [Desulfuromonas sp.]
MTGLTLLREMDHLSREMDGLFRGFGRFLEPPFASGNGGRYHSFCLRENAEGYTLDARLPGVTPEALEMTFQDGALTIAGERTAAAPDGATWHRRERSAGRFARTVDIPAPIDAEGVRAEFRDGVLNVTLPKAAEAKPKRIAIKAA